MTDGYSEDEIKGVVTVTCIKELTGKWKVDKEITGSSFTLVNIPTNNQYTSKSCDLLYFSLL